MSLEERFEQLARSNRRLRKLNGICIAATIAIIAFGAANQRKLRDDVVTAKRLVIVDDAGKERIILSTKNDEASIVINAEDSLVNLSASKNQFDVFETAGKDEKSSLSYLLGTDTNVVHWLFSNPGFGTQQATMFATATGNGFSAWAPNGSNSRISARMLRPDETPRLILDSKDGKTKCLVSLDKDGQPNIAVGGTNLPQDVVSEGKVKITKDRTGKYVVTPLP